MGRGQAREGTVYSRIAVLRVERGLSRRALADALGVSYHTIGYLERGEYAPSLALALKMASYFQVPVEGLFSLEPFVPMSTRLYDGVDAVWGMAQ